MRDEDLKRAFDSASHVQPRDKARALARQAALAAFDVENRIADNQGMSDIDRHTPDAHKIVRRKKMMVLKQRWMLSGLASAAVLIVGVMLFVNMMPRKNLVTHSVTPRVTQAAKSTAPAQIKPGGSGGNMGTGHVDYLTRRDQLANVPADTQAGTRDEYLQEPVVNGAPDSESAKSTAPEQTVLGGSGGNTGMGRVDYMMRRQAMAQVPADTLGSARDEYLQAPVMNDLANSEEPNTPYYTEIDRDQFAKFTPNPVRLVTQKPVSTFSIDVDTASYSFVRRSLNDGYLPQKDAVRLEEMVNYFDYDYPAPTDKTRPFRASITVIDSPWKTGNKLVDIGIKGYDLPAGSWPKSNIVFLLDVSGSMDSPDKLPLVKQSIGLLLGKLQPKDTVAIVAYAGDSRVVLLPTPVKDKPKIMAALQSLQAGGSTAGAAGIQQAYQLAESSFVKGGVNRVIMATDGDFNVGITNIDELKGYVERQRKSGVYLSVLGFGVGDYNDKLMQALAQNGNGVAAYIDTLSEARKVLVDEATSTLFPIAKDVKIQVEFNPATVSEYRLLGYETRMLKREDFKNDKVDAGDIGAGHTVTAIYEITPLGAKSGLIGKRRYGGKAAASTDAHGNEYGYVKIRYKLPTENTSRLISQPIPVNQSAANSHLQHEAKFAASVAGFAQLLKGGKYTGNWNYKDAIALARANKGDDPYGYRSEFIQLIRKASVAEAMPNQQ